MQQKEISKAVIKRLPTYLSYLRNLPEDAPPNISATTLANALGMGEVQVRKDLAMVCSFGRPKVGYPRDRLADDIEQFLGYDNTNDAVIIGAGRLGQALLGYNGFEAYGLNIVAAFDANPVGNTIFGKPMMHIDQLANYCRSHKVLMGIITVPAAYAQDVCDHMVECGIQAIWNFAPTHLTVPDDVVVQNENLAVSLTSLRIQMTKEL